VASGQNRLVTPRRAAAAADGGSLASDEAPQALREKLTGGQE